MSLSEEEEGVVINESDAVQGDDYQITNPAILDRRHYRGRLTPIMVTLTDQLVNPVDLQQMIEAGMSIARIRLAHMTVGEKVRLLDNLQKAATTTSEKYGVMHWPLSTCLELKTCTVKTGIICDSYRESYVTLKEGTTVTLTHNIALYDKCGENLVFVDNPYLCTNAVEGSEVSIDQDEIVLICTEVCPQTKSIICVVRHGGILQSLVQVCIRGTKHNRPYLTKKDAQLINFAIDNEVDVIVLNYVRHPETLKRLKQIVSERNAHRPLVLCGVCTQVGLNNIDTIIKDADGLILPRDIITYELLSSDAYRMSRIQKVLGAKCREAGKPFYVGGGVLQTALKTGEILDNEIADVTNALMDGATGLILRESHDVDLSIRTIKYLHELCLEIEPFLISLENFWRVLESPKMPINAATAAALSCNMLAMQSKAHAIILPTVSGATVKSVLWLRPPCFIITISKKPSITRKMHAYRGLRPLLYSTTKKFNTWTELVNDRIQFAVTFAVKSRWLQYGDKYVSMYRGMDYSSYCDTVSVWTVSITEKKTMDCEAPIRRHD